MHNKRPTWLLPSIGSPRSGVLVSEPASPRQGTRQLTWNALASVPHCCQFTTLTSADVIYVGAQSPTAVAWPGWVLNRWPPQGNNDVVLRSWRSGDAVLSRERVKRYGSG